MFVRNWERTTVTKESVFKIIDEADFLEMNHSDVQNILRDQHIVVMNKQHRQRSFGEALTDVAPLDWVTGIQGDLFRPLNMTDN